MLIGEKEKFLKDLKEYFICVLIYASIHIIMELVGCLYPAYTDICHVIALSFSSPIAIITIIMLFRLSKFKKD